MTNFSEPKGDTPDFKRDSDFHEALLAMTGHDLRTPLQIIFSANASLKRRLTSVAEREYVERSHQASLLILEQLDDVVEALRIHDRAGGGCPEPISLAPVLTYIEEQHAIEARDRGVMLTVIPCHAEILSDSILLKGILRNLIRNALKNTQAGGRVLVGCRRRSTKECIEVWDTGVGIPADQVERIFDAFRQLGSAPAEGLGLGLFIVRRAASALEHEVQVWSVPGRGSRFSVVADRICA